MKNIIKYLTLTLSAVLLLLCAVPTVIADETAKSLDSGYANVADFGAEGVDSKDDTEAFEAALATGKSLYIPAGNYYVSKTIKLTNRIVKGAGPNSTTIFGTITDKTAPIIIMEGVSSLCDLKVSFKDIKDCETANEGEKVGIQLGSKEKGLMPGSVLHSLVIAQVGTAIYNPKYAACDGIRIENVDISPFYRGVDMQGENRKSNSYSNIYPNNHNVEKAIEIDCGFALEGSSYGETLHQINVEHNAYSFAALSLKNAKNFNFSSLHFEGTNLTKADSGTIYCENSSGYFGGVVQYFPYINHFGNSFLRLGDSDGKNVIVFDIIHQRGLNGPDPGQHIDWCNDLLEVRGLDRGLVKGGPEAADYVQFRRAKDAKGEYEITLNYYSYHTIIGGDGHRYRDFVKKGDNLTFNITHEPKEVLR